ncbi:hypothetical protein QR98_0068110 [Sarcoptes scabiei]|uniref:Uncharacterized protein n=1 Tax=Sarcoptes scabiei TaxID=52283 RepID=A0A132ACJ5_SARSC|nr:hypothetical protein QR98_0068110 [Sarcoptes scabiei]
MPSTESNADNSILRKQLAAIEINWCLNPSIQCDDFYADWKQKFDVILSKNLIEKFLSILNETNGKCDSLSFELSAESDDDLAGSNENAKQMPTKNGTKRNKKKMESEHPAFSSGSSKSDLKETKSSNKKSSEKEENLVKEEAEIESKPKKARNIVKQKSKIEPTQKPTRTSQRTKKQSN